eukprot:2632056-Pleurochrysis_carterae.AAC.2
MRRASASEQRHTTAKATSTTTEAAAAAATATGIGTGTGTLALTTDPTPWHSHRHKLRSTCIRANGRRGTITALTAAAASAQGPTVQTWSSEFLLTQPTLSCQIISIDIIECVSKRAQQAAASPRLQRRHAQEDFRANSRMQALGFAHAKQQGSMAQEDTIANAQRCEPLLHAKRPTVVGEKECRQALTRRNLRVTQPQSDEISELQSFRVTKPQSAETSELQSFRVTKTQSDESTE